MQQSSILGKLLQDDSLQLEIIVTGEFYRSLLLNMSK